jgi:hypothetical protein
MAMDVGAQGYGSVGYGMAPITVTLRTRIDVGRIGYGQTPYGWGGYGGAAFPAPTSGDGVSHLIHWRRRGRR